MSVLFKLAAMSTHIELSLASTHVAAGKIRKSIHLLNWPIYFSDEGRARAHMKDWFALRFNWNDNDISRRRQIKVT